MLEQEKRKARIFETSWNPHLEPETSILRLTRRQRVLIEPDLFDSGFAEREIDRIVGTVALSPRQQFFVHTSRADRLLQWATRGRKPILTGSLIAGQAGLLLKSLGEDAESWKWLRHSPWLHVLGPCLPFPPRNLWIGVDLSCQQTADGRLADFLQAPIPRCFVWARLTEAVNLTRWLSPPNQPDYSLVRSWFVVVNPPKPAQHPWLVGLQRQCLGLRVPLLTQPRNAIRPIGAGTATVFKNY